MVRFYLKSALRSISRKRNFSILSMLGLSIGIAVFLLSLEYYSYETGFNLFHKNLPRIYRVNTSGKEGKLAETAPAIATMMKDISQVKQAVRIADNFNSGAVITFQPGKDPSLRKSFSEEGCIFVDKAFLDLFSFPFKEGSNELDKPNTVVITAAVAKKIFGDANAIGQTIELHNQFGVLPCKVTGVLADLPLQSDIKFDYLFPIATLDNSKYIEGSDWARLNSWGNNSYTTFIGLNDDANPHSVEKTASALFARLDPDYKPEDGTIELQPLKEMHLGNGLRDNNPVYGSLTMTYFIFGLGVLILAIAWINYINFSTAHALSKAKEIGIHKIIGSSKSQIVKRYIAESFLLNVAAFFFAFIIVSLTQELFNYLTTKPLSISLIRLPKIIFFCAAILSLGIAVCGAYVGWVLSRFKPMSIIRFNDKGNIGSVFLRKGLIVFQFVIAITFIASTITAYQQIGFFKHHDLGINIDDKIVVNGPQIKDSTTKTSSVFFKNELKKLPFVEGICSMGSIPGDGFAHNFGMDGLTRLNPAKGDERKNYFASEVDENFFPLYNIGFLYGRNFTSEETEKGFKAGKLILNETAAKTLGFSIAEAVGKTVKWSDKLWEVVAVVKDYHHRSLKEKIEPIVYIPVHSNSCFTVKLNLAMLSQKANIIKGIYEKNYPGNPFSFQVLRDVYNKEYAEEERSGSVAMSISILVILISCLGLIGLSLYTAKSRTKEIGVRKVLGASTLSLFSLLSKDFLLLVLIAFLIACPITWVLMDKWLSNFAYHTEVSWQVFLIAGALAILIALVTISYQSIKAAIADPVKSLRTE